MFFDTHPTTDKLGVFQVAHEALGGGTNGRGSRGAEGELCGEQKTVPSLGGYRSSGDMVVLGDNCLASPPSVCVLCLAANL